MALCECCATAAAFAFTRLEFPGRRIIYRVMLIGLLLPPHRLEFLGEFVEQAANSRNGAPVKALVYCFCGL